MLVLSWVYPRLKSCFVDSGYLVLIITTLIKLVFLPCLTGNHLSAQTPPEISRQSKQVEQSWQLPSNWEQLTYEELFERFSNSPFAYLTESFSNVPAFLIVGLLNIDTNDTEPWERSLPFTRDEKLINELENELETSAEALVLPKTEADVAINRFYRLTLQTSLQRVLQVNRAIKLQDIALERDRQQLRIERAELFPQLRVNALVRQQDETVQTYTYEYPRSLPGITTRTYAESGGYQRDAEVGVGITYSYPLLFGTLQPQIRQAKIQTQQSELESDITLRDVLLDVKLGYYGLQEQRARLLIVAQSLVRAVRNLEDARTRLQPNLDTNLAVSRAEVQVLRDQQRLLDALTELLQGAYEFANLLELPLDVLALTADPVQKIAEWNLSLEETILLALENRLELDVIELEQEKLQAGLQEEYAEALPTLSLKVSANIGTDFDSNNRFKVTDGEQTIGELKETKTFEIDYSVGIFVDWSLQGGESVGKIQRAKLALESNTLRFAERRDIIREEAVEAYLEFISNQKNLERSQLEVDIARQALEQAQQAIRVNEINQSDLISAERDLTDAQFQLLGTIINYNEAISRLNRITGKITSF